MQISYAEAKARLEARWPKGMAGGQLLARYSDDPAERIPMMTPESVLAVLFPEED